MKKILCTVLAVIMCFFTLSVATSAAEPMKIVVSDAVVDYGATEATVTINIPNNPGIALLGFNVNYDDNAMTLKSATLGSIFTGDLECNLEAVPFVFNVYTGSSNKTASGTLVTLKFDLTANCEAKTYDITVDNVEALNIDEEPVSYTITNGSVKVKAKDMAGLSFNDATYTYDGTEKSIVVNGVPSGATVTYTCDNTTENKAIDAGTYRITATVSKKGYNDWTATKTLKINKRALTVTGLTALNKTYDGTTSASLSGGTLSGLVSRDASGAYCSEHGCYRLQYTIPTEGTFADKNVGSNKAIAIDTIVLDGCSKDNYTLTQPTVRATITRAPITVTAKNVTIRKGAPMPTFGPDSYVITAGELFGSDKLTGSVATNCYSTSVVGDYTITQGSLTAGSNYNLTFIHGKLSVIDKTPQNIVVDGIVTTKTYGDDGFKVTVTPDVTSGLNNFTMNSSNADVATIDAEGNVVIKNAGSTKISIKEAGNEEYAAYENTWTLTVNKAEIVVTADDKVKKIGQTDPELTYTYTGTLIGTDAFTGSLTRQPGEAIGRYDILIGTLALTDNYAITYKKATFEIVDKTPQTIGLADIDAKTYGDASFKVTAIADTISQLDAYTYESDNTDVATIDAEGNVTIVGVGTANITVYQAGNDEYAAAKASKELVVNKKNITLTDIDLVNETATFDGVLATDSAAVTIDFEKLDTVVNAETSKVMVSNLILAGEKSDNYVLTTTEMEKDVVINAGTITAPENVTVTVQKAEGTKTVIIDSMDVSAVPEDTSKITLDMTENGAVDTVTIPKSAVNGLKDKSTLEIILTDGVVSLDKDALASIDDAATSSDVTIKLDKVTDEQLKDEQVAEKNKRSNPVVYDIALDGVTDVDFDGGQVTVTVDYEPTTSGNVKVMLLKEDGTTEVVYASYDGINKKVTMRISQFADYVVYTEPYAHHGGGGAAPTPTATPAPTAQPAVTKQNVYVADKDLDNDEEDIATEPAETEKPSKEEKVESSTTEIESGEETVMTEVNAGGKKVRNILLAGLGIVALGAGIFLILIGKKKDD